EGFAQKTKRCGARARHLKKGNRHLLQGRRSMYRFIAANREVYSVEKMCDVLSLSSSCFYRCLVTPESPGEQRVKILVEKIQKIHKERDCIYGSPRITAELHKVGDPVSRS